MILHIIGNCYTVCELIVRRDRCGIIGVVVRAIGSIIFDDAYECGCHISSTIAQFQLRHPIGNAFRIV